MVPDPHDANLRARERGGRDGIERTPPPGQFEPEQVWEVPERPWHEPSRDSISEERTLPEPGRELSELPALRLARRAKLPLVNKDFDVRHRFIPCGRRLQLAKTTAGPEARVLVQGPHDPACGVLGDEVEALQLLQARPYRRVPNALGAHPPLDLRESERSLVVGRCAAEDFLNFVDRYESRARRPSGSGRQDSGRRYRMTNMSYDVYVSSQSSNGGPYRLRLRGVRRFGPVLPRRREVTPLL